MIQKNIKDTIFLMHNIACHLVFHISCCPSTVSCPKWALPKVSPWDKNLGANSLFGRRLQETLRKGDELLKGVFTIHRLLLWATGFTPAGNPLSTCKEHISGLSLLPKGWGNVNIYPSTPVATGLRASIRALNPRPCGYSHIGPV